jgi:hypothetical protein
MGSFSKRPRYNQQLKHFWIGESLEPLWFSGENGKYGSWLSRCPLRVDSRKHADLKFDASHQFCAGLNAKMVFFFVLLFFICQSFVISIVPFFVVLRFCFWLFIIVFYYYSCYCFIFLCFAVLLITFSFLSFFYFYCSTCYFLFRYSFRLLLFFLLLFVSLTFNVFCPFTGCPSPSVVSFPLSGIVQNKYRHLMVYSSNSHHLRSDFRTMKSSCTKRPAKFQVRSRPPFFVSQQEAPYQSENESLAARVLSGRKRKSQMVLYLGNMGDAWQIWLFFATSSRERQCGIENYSGEWLICISLLVSITDR